MPNTEQYTPESIAHYELIYGRDFVSPGGAEKAETLIGSMNLNKNDFVLDVGCGLGGSAFLMAKKFGLKVDAIDLSAHMVTQAEHRCMQYELQDSVNISNLNCLDLKTSNTYNAIYSRDVFLHIEEKSRLFNVLRRAIKPGGILLFTDYCSGVTPSSKEFNHYIQQRSYHLCGISDYARLVEDAGWTLISAEDRSADFLSIIKAEKKTILSKLAPSTLRKHLIASRDKKMDFVLSGEHKWGLVHAIFQP